jgi:hypothetical protein
MYITMDPALKRWAILKREDKFVDALLATENSPALQRWVNRPQFEQVPAGTTESSSTGIRQARV